MLSAFFCFQTAARKSRTMSLVPEGQDGTGSGSVQGFYSRFFRLMSGLSSFCLKNLIRDMNSVSVATIKTQTEKQKGEQQMAAAVFSFLAVMFEFWGKFQRKLRV